MRKIKKFKIPIYTYDILRKAKKRKIDLFALGLADRKAPGIYSSAAALEPSTVFDLLAAEDELAKKDGPLRGEAGTLGVITLGAAFETKLKTITDPGLFALAETAALVFSDTGLKVIAELSGQEVSAEGLDLGKPRHVCAYPAPETEEPPTRQADAAALSAVLARLSADKIGVTMGRRNPEIFPEHPWLAKESKRAREQESERK